MNNVHCRFEICVFAHCAHVVWTNICLMVVRWKDFVMTISFEWYIGLIYITDILQSVWWRTVSIFIQVCIQRCLSRGEAGSGRSDDNIESLRKRWMFAVDIETYEVNSLQARQLSSFTQPCKRIQRHPIRCTLLQLVSYNVSYSIKKWC